MLKWSSFLGDSVLFVTYLLAFNNFDCISLYSLDFDETYILHIFYLSIVRIFTKLWLMFVANGMSLHEKKINKILSQWEKTEKLKWISKDFFLLGKYLTYLSEPNIGWIDVWMNESITEFKANKSILQRSPFTFSNFSSDNF